MLLRATGKGKTLADQDGLRMRYFVQFFQEYVLREDKIHARQGNLLRIQKNDEGPVLPSRGSQSNWGDGRAIPQQGEAASSPLMGVQP